MMLHYFLGKVVTQKKIPPRKLKSHPLSNGSTFEFDVAFDNLSEYELGLLCYALKPSKDFRHKLGMGKPIGLGSVNIDITELVLIDRHQRYAKDTLTTDRYHDETSKVNDLRNDFIKTMDKDIHQALELLGDPLNVKAPVHYPQVRNGDIEETTYRWFAANDRQDNQNKQHLTALNANTTQLPTLNQ
ncbi:MAG: hypothetical protein WCP96_15085 [Methylococcaceae bacterium]